MHENVYVYILHVCLGVQLDYSSCFISCCPWYLNLSALQFGNELSSINRFLLYECTIIFLEIGNNAVL